MYCRYCIRVLVFMALLQLILACYFMAQYRTRISLPPPREMIFVTINGKRKNLTVLYMAPIRHFAQKRVICQSLLYMPPGMGGNCKLGIISKRQGKWLSEAADIKAVYRPGNDLRNKRSLWGKATVQVTVLALAASEDHYQTEIVVMQRIELAWVFGVVASGKILTRWRYWCRSGIIFLPATRIYCRDNICTVTGKTFRLQYGFPNR